jgi:phosphoglycerate dehydrogenase-like enzyme
MSAGFEGWLPVTPAGVTICNGRGVHGASTAELAVTGLLMHWHDMPVLLEQQRAHRWQATTRDSARDKDVLVLGAGDIAGKVAEVLATLGARTTLVGRKQRDGVRSVDDLPQLCAGRDALVVAVPLTEQTRGLVDAALLARLPDRAVVVNIARGPIVVTDDLVRELSARRLRAVLDVTDPEPLPAGHALWDMPDLILTPHVGGGAAGWLELAQRLVIEQVRRYLSGEPLDNVVRPAGS